MFDFTPHDLRRNLTVSEKILWDYLRARRMVGLKFRRQHQIGPFIVDFVCLSNKVIIEADGSIHDDTQSHDRKRDQWLKQQGFTVIRIKNEELEQNRMQVLMRLRDYFLERM